MEKTSTGLKDKNGKEIFKGNTLKHGDKTYYVKFSENQQCLILMEVGSLTNWRSLEWCKNVSKYIEVIGDIDNPEFI